MNDFFGLNVSFWEKDDPRVIGDLLNRPGAIEALGEIKGKIVADIGCGTGYVSRILARKGAVVWASDISKPMLRSAKEIESTKPLGIRYDIADMGNLPYGEESVDCALFLSVLVYASPDNFLKGIKDAHRILKKGGKLVIGGIHPDIASKFFNKLEWIEYSWSGSLEDGKMLNLTYVDKDGAKFSAVVGHYSKTYYENILREVGFDFEQIQDVVVTKEAVEFSPHWGHKFGYPGFVKIIALK